MLSHLLRSLGPLVALSFVLWPAVADAALKMRGVATVGVAPGNEDSGQFEDVNGDGRLDLAIQGTGGLGVLINTSAADSDDADFNFPAVAVSSIANTVDLATGDFNQDGRPDFALASSG